MATKITLMPDAPVCPEGYELHLYCRYDNPTHGFDAFPHVVTGRTRGDCNKTAKAHGWKRHEDGTATCPKCVAALKEPRNPE